MIKKIFSSQQNQESKESIKLKIKKIETFTDEELKEIIIIIAKKLKII